MPDLEEEGCKAAMCGEDTALTVFQSHFTFSAGLSRHQHERGGGFIALSQMREQQEY